MLQRPQTLFLLGVSLVLIASLFFTFWHKEHQKNTHREVVELDAFHLVHKKVNSNTGKEQVLKEKSTFFIAILGILGAVSAFYSLTRYKNRLLQIKLAALNAILMAGMLGLSVYYIWEADQLIGSQYGGHYHFGFYLPAIGLILNILANRFIRKDENLVKSAERFR